MRVDPWPTEFPIELLLALVVLLLALVWLRHTVAPGPTSQTYGAVLLVAMIPLVAIVTFILPALGIALVAGLIALFALRRTLARR